MTHLATGTPILNIASTVDAMAAAQPHKPAIFFPYSRDESGRVSYTHYTYQQLVDATNQIAAGLGAYGLKPGSRVVLMVTPSLEFAALAFALFKAGIIPVMIDPGIDRKSLKQCLSEAEPDGFIGIPKAHLGRVLLGWGRETIKYNVTVGRKGPWGGVTLHTIMRMGKGEGAFKMVDTHPDDMAAIAFTSGSTGVPKGAVYRHENFTAMLAILRDTYDMRPGETNLPTFPLFSLFDPGMGMTTIIPDMDAAHPARVDPAKIIEPIENFGITNMFGSPAVLDKVSRYGEAHNIKLPTLRRVISAGAPVPSDVMERFCKMLSPEAEIFTPYGATEALPVASIGSRELLNETRHKTDQGAGVCVGRPVDVVTARVIRISDEPIPEWDDELVVPDGEIGELTVMGPTVSHAYYNRPHQTALAKIKGPDGRIIHRMGDLAYIDEQGRLWFCGRKSHRVETPERTYFTKPCETVFNIHPLVYRTGLVGVSIDGETRPVLCVELEEVAKKTADHEQIVRELLEIGATQPHTSSIKIFLFHPSFPVDIRHNSKIFREKLAPWAEKEISSSTHRV